MVEYRFWMRRFVVNQIIRGNNKAGINKGMPRMLGILN